MLFFSDLIIYDDSDDLLMTIWSALFDVLALADELLQRQVSYKQFISLIEVLLDDSVFTLMTERAEVFLFLLFEDKNIIVEMILGKQPIYQHQVFPNIKQNRISLYQHTCTWGRIYFCITALKYTLLFVSNNTVYQFKPQYVYMFLWSNTKALPTFTNSSNLLR